MIKVRQLNDWKNWEKVIACCEIAYKSQLWVGYYFEWCNYNGVLHSKRNITKKKKGK